MVIELSVTTINIHYAVVQFCNHSFDFRPNCTPIHSVQLPLFISFPCFSGTTNYGETLSPFDNRPEMEDMASSMRRINHLWTLKMATVYKKCMGDMIECRISLM